MFSRFFIDRPVFATVIALLMVIAGGVAIPLLPVEQYPQVTPPTVRVQTSYAGANAQTLIDTVTAPLEQQINGVEGMIYMKSTSDDTGGVSITVTFEIGTDPDLAAVRVQNRVAVAEARLPDEVRRRGIVITKESPSLLMAISLVSQKDDDGNLIYDQAFLSNYATLFVKDRLTRVEGVGSATVFGARDFSMRIWLDPHKLAERDLTAEDVLTALRAQNVQVAAGQLGAPPAATRTGFEYTLTTQGRLNTAEEFAQIVLKVGQEHRLVRIGDVARVELGAESYNMFSRRNGQDAATLGIYQLPGSNALNTAAGLEAAMQELSADFPQGLEYTLTFDFTRFIRASIQEVITTLLIVAALVVFVIFVFLHDWRATLIPAITIPVSLIGTLAVMLALGFSLNMLTMFGLVLAIGIVVDDAIVVVENCTRLINTTQPDPKLAAKEAMRQITGPVIATTLVVLAVFIPASVLPGMTGRLYQPFAVTLSVATAISSINALTLSPALCALILRPSPDKPALPFRLFNAALGRGTAAYLWSVRRAVGLPLAVIALYLVLGTATGWLFLRTPTGFLPEEDQGYFFVNVQLPDAAKLDRTDGVLAQVEDILLDTSGVSDVIGIGGFSLLTGANESNTATAVVILDPWAQRGAQRPASRIIGEVFGRVSAIPDAMIFPFAPPPILGLGAAGGFSYELQDRSALGYDALQQATDNLAAAAGQDPRIARAFTGFRADVPRYFIDVDRTKALRLGVSMSDLFNTLTTNLGGTYVNDVNLFGRVYRVFVQADAVFRESVEDIGLLKVRSRDGRMVPIDTLAKVRDDAGPRVINRYNLYPSASFSGSVAPGYSSGDAVIAMGELSAQVLPPGMGYEWTGSTYQQIKAGNVAPFAFGLGLLVVFMVLAAQYESWSIPLAILLAVPLAVLGALLGIGARGMSNDIYVQIGLVLLIAMVAKNAILIVEFAKLERENGKPIREAALGAAKLRFRPILMTALAFVLGTSPLLVAVGAGAASRQVLGTTVFAGMLLATAVGLLLTPCFYTIIQSTSERLRRKHPRTPTNPTPTPPSSEATPGATPT